MIHYSLTNSIFPPCHIKSNLCASKKNCYADHSDTCRLITNKMHVCRCANTSGPVIILYSKYFLSIVKSDFVFVEVGAALSTNTVFWGSWRSLNCKPSPALTLEWFFLGLSNLRMVISGSISGSSAHETLTHLSRLWGETSKSPRNLSGLCWKVFRRREDFKLSAHQTTTI